MKPKNTIAKELAKLARKHGGQLRPEVVVESARDPKSPLHSSFNWDDTEAAIQWRLQQARMLIRAVVTYESVGDGKTVKVRPYVSLSSDRTEGGPGYRTLVSVMSDDELRAQMLVDARDDMQRFKAKYRALKELVDVFEAMDRAAA
jgi:hypothetical protein